MAKPPPQNFGVNQSWLELALVSGQPTTVDSIVQVQLTKNKWTVLVFWKILALDVDTPYAAVQFDHYQLV